MGYAEGNTQGYTREDAVLDEKEYIKEIKTMTYDENLNPVIDAETKEAWDKAIDLNDLCRYNPKDCPKWVNLKLLDIKMEAYGDRRLYVDPVTGKYYEEYTSIGD